MDLKNCIPLSFRDQWRPACQKLQRNWLESSWSRKPRSWSWIRESVHKESDFETILQTAASEFGITQVKSEIRGLINLLEIHAPQTVVEVGTHKGGNSFLFCHALPSVAKVVGIDLCVQNSSKLIFFSRPQQVYHALHGNSQAAETRLRVERVLRGRPVDFLFIDGDHSYKGVRADFELYYPLVRPGGIIALHDIIPDHRTRYGRDTGCYAGEVHRFWKELKQSFDYEELVDNPDQDGFGIGVIRIPNAIGS